MKRISLLALTLAMCAAFAMPAWAYDMSKAGERTVLSAGDDFTAFIKPDGSLWSRGYNLFGQLGNGTTVDSAVPVKVMDGVATVSCGGGTITSQPSRPTAACGLGGLTYTIS